MLVTLVTLVTIGGLHWGVLPGTEGVRRGGRGWGRGTQEQGARGKGGGRQRGGAYTC